MRKSQLAVAIATVLLTASPSPSAFADSQGGADSNDGGSTPSTSPGENTINDPLASEDYLRTLPESPDGRTYNPLYRPKLTPVQDKNMVSVTVDGEEFKLTPQEYNEVQLKRRALLRKMYDDHEMARLRSMMEREQDDQAYQEALDSRFPLSPEQILNLRRKDLERTRAENRPVVGNVESSIRTVSLDLDSQEPITLNVSTGFISALVFFDQNGKPWPIKGDVIADDNAFASGKIGDAGHIATFEIKQSFAQSNALLELEGLNSPLSIRLVGEEGKVDAKLSVRVPRFGPKSEQGPVRTSSRSEAASPVMMELLNTGRIAGAEQYALDGVQGLVFYQDGALFIRSKATLTVPPIQPPMSQEVRSPTGYRIYKIPPVTNLMFADEGRLVRATVKEKDSINLSAKPSIFPRATE